MNGNTKLSEALDARPDILEYIISLNPHDFERLRNPLMRRVMPVRISLGRIAAMVKMPESEFVNRINALAGLPPEELEERQAALPQSPTEKPSWLIDAKPESIHWVDVTPLDEVLGDPMPPINIGINAMKSGDILGIKHKWEPQPFFDIWHSRGLEYWTEQMNHDLWHIFVHKKQ